jgi:hypothetical protein
MGLLYLYLYLYLHLYQGYGMIILKVQNKTIQHNNKIIFLTKYKHYLEWSEESHIPRIINPYPANVEKIVS